MNFPVISSPIPVTATHTGGGSTLVVTPQPNLGISPALLEGTPSPVHSPPAPGDKEASGGLVYGVMGAASAWWTPIQAQQQEDDHSVKVSPARRHSKRINTSTSSAQVNTISPREEEEEEEDEDNITDDEKEPAQVEMVVMSTRPRLRKVDDKGQLVWPFELETVLIAGLRKYHATSCRPRPSASRNFNRNKLVAEYIESMTGIKRTTKQIASRIQVLRETWRGKKEFTLVAQPRELSEMGYLPPFDGQIIGTGTSVAPVVIEDAGASTGPGPVRNARRTTRKASKGGKADKRGKKGVAVVVDGDADAADDDDGFDEYQPQPSQQEQEHYENTRVSRQSLKASRSHPQVAPTRNNRLHHQHPSLAPTHALVPALAPAPALTTTVSFDPYRLDTLGPPQTSLENLLPPSALFFVRNTLQKGPGKGVKKTTILAKCTLSSRSHPRPRGDGILSEVQILLEIDPASIRRGIEAFQETRAQRVRLGSHVQLLQSSAIWDEEEEDEDGGDAGLVERLGAAGSGSGSGSVHRYALELQLSARQALASGRRQVIIVQNLSLLRVSDSRVVDSWAIIWVVGTSPRKQQQQPRLELVPISDMPDASLRERERGEGPSSSSSQSRIPVPSPGESEMFSSPELTPSPILPAMVPASSSNVEDIILPLPHNSFSLPQQSDYSPQVNSPEGSPLSASSSPSPIELAPLSLPLDHHEEDMLHAAGRVCTPLSLTLSPVIMTELVNDSPLYVPMPVEEIHEEFVQDVHMRSRFSQSQARLEAPEHTMAVEYPAIMHQEHSIPSILHNYTTSPNYTSPPNYNTPPQMPSPPPPPPVISYPVVQHPIPRARHSYPPTHIVSPGSARSMIRDNLGPAPNLHPSLPVHYHHHHQMHHSASHIIPDEWHHAGHDHFAQTEVDPRYEEGSSYHHRHPVYVQHVQTPPSHHQHHQHHQNEPRFAYLEEVMQEPIPSPTSAGSTSSQQTQFHMAHGHGNGHGQPLVEQGWYPVGSPVRGVSPGPSYPYRRFSEASIWGGAESYPSTTRTSFSSSGRGASVPPVLVNGIDMPPPPPFHPIPHQAPVQYVFVDDSFNAPNAYISDDTSGHRFPASPERPPRSQHQPSYHHLQQHANMMLPVEPSVYGVYQY